MIIEMRTYKIKPGKRSQFLDIFRSKSVPAHTEIGMKISGPFLSVEDPDTFFFMRGFPDIASREPMKARFYEGELWKRELENILMPMIEKYEVVVVEVPEEQVHWSWAHDMHEERVRPGGVDIAALRALLDELAGFGRQHDARETEHSRRMLNVTPETGQFLAILVRATRAAQILEIGTSNGYSTIWLAWAARDTGGHVTTLERSPDKAAMARANLQRAGLADRVTVREGTALDILAGLDGPYDLIFLDADRPNYLAYLGRILPRLRPGGLLVADNVVSHAGELRDFLRALQSDSGLDTVILPVGNGEALTYRKP